MAPQLQDLRAAGKCCRTRQKCVPCVCVAYAHVCITEAANRAAACTQKECRVWYQSSRAAGHKSLLCSIWCDSQTVPCLFASPLLAAVEAFSRQGQNGLPGGLLLDAWNEEAVLQAEQVRGHSVW